MKGKAQNQQRVRANIGDRVVKTFMAVMVAVQLAACGGGGGGGSGASGSVTPSATTPARVTGTTTTSETTPSSSTGGQSSLTATGSLALTWVAPVARTDGTPLSLADIDGFRIYYGHSAGDYPYHVNVTDATMQQVTLKNLASGTWYIVMTAYDVDGRESGYSVVVKKTVS